MATVSAKKGTRVQECKLKSTIFPRCCEAVRDPSTATAEGNFRADTRDFESLPLETDTRGHLYKVERSEEDLKRTEEEEDDEAAATAAER